MHHILVVDDEAAIAYLFARDFRIHGYRVTVAYDGQSALDLVRDDPADGVVTDFRMPGMNGQEMLIRMRERQPDLPAVIVSAYTQAVGPENARTRVMSKPVDTGAIV